MCMLTKSREGKDMVSRTCNQIDQNLCLIMISRRYARPSSLLKFICEDHVQHTLSVIWPLRLVATGKNVAKVTIIASCG
jgi:hypothetical protein